MEVIIIKGVIIRAIIGAVVMETTIGVLKGFKVQERISSYIQSAVEPQDR